MFSSFFELEKIQKAPLLQWYVFKFKAVKINAWVDF